MKSEEEIRNEYTHAQRNVHIMAEVCDHLPKKKPIMTLQWYRGYVAALRWALSEEKQQ
jgi:hypothetical protein